MNYYFDIKLNPDSEMPLNQLLNVVYTKFHKALYDLSSQSIGVSFPRYNIILGNVVRVHGDAKALENLREINWLGGISGYCDVITIKQVPHNVQYRTISRVQPNMSLSDLRRLTKRHSISEGVVKEYKAKMFSKGLDNPFVELDSGSSGNKYRRYFQFGVLLDEPIQGIFDQFGLSKTATVPWFPAG